MELSVILLNAIALSIVKFNLKCNMSATEKNKNISFTKIKINTHEIE